MPWANEDISDRSQRVYFFFILLTVASLGLSRVDFLTENGMTLLHPERLFILVLFFYFLYILFHTSSVKFHSLDLAILAFFGMMLVRLVMDSFQKYPIGQSVTLVIQLMISVAFYLSLGSFPFKRRHVLYVFRVWLIVVLLVSFYGFYQIFARNLGLPFAYLEFGTFVTAEANLFGYQRPTSIFDEPTHYSGFVLPAYVFLTYLHLKGSSQLLMFNNHLGNTLMLVFLWTNYFLIASLGGYLVVMAMVAIAAMFETKLRRGAILFGVGVLLSGSIILTFGQGLNLLYAPTFRIYHFFESVGGVILSGGKVSGSIGVRLTRLFWAFEIWLERPLFGIGINNIKYSSGLTEPQWYRGRSLLPVTHSTLALLLSSTGIIGLVTYGAVLVTSGRVLLGLRSRLMLRGDRVMSIGVGYALLASLCIGFFSLSFVHPLNWFYFGLLAMLVSYSYYI